MSWLDFIGNIGNKVSNLQSKVGSAVGQALIGKQEPMIDYVDIKGVDTNSPEYKENMPVAEIGVTEAPRVGGLLNDIRNGAKENFATGFAAPNWEQNITPDGRKKGLGYRFGEGLGSFARFAESPLGRGLLMAGIVGASGGSGLEALGYGAGAGLGNQQARMKDNIYRNSLIEQGQNSLRNTAGFANLDPAEQQAQLDRIANQVNSYRGYLGDDTYKQVLAGMQMQDNAAYRNALLASNLKNQEIDNEMARERFNYTKQQDAIENAQRWAQINKADQPKPLSDSQVEKINTAQDTIATLNDIETRYSNPKYKNAFGLSGAWRAQQAKDHPIAYAPFDNEITLVRQDIEMLRQRYAKAMEGGRMSDSDRAFYQNVLMSQNLSYENFLEGVKRLKIHEEKALQRRITNYGLQGKNVNEFENLYNTEQAQMPAEGTIIKNKQGQKMIMRGGQWQAI